MALRRATELKPGHAAAQLKLAELMIRSRDEQLLKEAELRIQKILTSSPADEDALFALAAAQAQLGKTEDAEKYLVMWSKRSPSNLRSQMALALLKVSEKDLAGAEQVLKTAIQQVPGSDDAVVALANLYVGMDRFSEAEPLFLKGVQLNPDNSDAWIAGRCSSEAGNTRVAEESFKRAAEASKTKAPRAYIVFLIRQNRRPQAIATLEKMAKADPDNRVIQRLSAGYLRGQPPAWAETILNDAIRKSPHDVEALLQHSQISFRKHNFGDALADLDNALIVTPDATGPLPWSRIFG